MPTYGTYASLSDVRTALGYASSDTADDTRLLQVLERVSRWIDDWCSRYFYVRTATRTFTAADSGELLLPDDLLSISTLKTDSDGDWDYDYTWATTDYHLYPFNEWPKWRLLAKSGGQYLFPSQVEGVQIAGSWGYGDGTAASPVEDSTTDTAEELDASETGVDVASGAVLSAGQTILVESEQMYVTAVSSNTATVRRGVNGTTAATHATGKDVYLYRYPGPVAEACIIQASRMFRRKDAPFGVAGSPEFGTATIISRLDPDVRKQLDAYRRIGAA